jgi:hypothetical protein
MDFETGSMPIEGVQPAMVILNNKRSVDELVHSLKDVRSDDPSELCSL